MSVRLLVIASCVAAIAVPTAYAKGRLAVRIADRTPAVGQSFAVDIHTD
jgi:hypothetical protein